MWTLEEMILINVQRLIAYLAAFSLICSYPKKMNGIVNMIAANDLVIEGTGTYRSSHGDRHLGTGACFHDYFICNLHSVLDLCIRCLRKQS